MNISFTRLRLLLLRFFRSKTHLDFILDLVYALLRIRFEEKLKFFEFICLGYFGIRIGTEEDLELLGCVVDDDESLLFREIGLLLFTLSSDAEMSSSSKTSSQSDSNSDISQFSSESHILSN